MSIKTLFVAAVLTAGALIGHAEAIEVLAGTFTIKIYQGDGGGSETNANVQADADNPLLSGPLLDTVTYEGSLNFNINQGGTNTIGAFLNSGSSTSITGLSDATAALTMSTASFAITTVLDITFVSGAIPDGLAKHDDGIGLYVNGLRRTDVAAAKPTVAVTTAFTGAAGNYRLIYVAANGRPQVLIVRGTPEPPPPPDAVNFSCRIDLTQVGSPLPAELQYVLTASTSEKFCPANNGGILKLKCSGKFPLPPQPQYTGSPIDTSAIDCQISRAQCGDNDVVEANVRSITVNPTTQSVELTCEYSSD